MNRQFKSLAGLLQARKWSAAKILGYGKVRILFGLGGGGGGEGKSLGILKSDVCGNHE